MLSQLLAWSRRHWRQLGMGAALLILALAGGRYWLFMQRLHAPLKLQGPHVFNVDPGSNFPRLLRHLPHRGTTANRDRPICVGDP